MAGDGGFTIRVDDLSGAAVQDLLRYHLAGMQATSPAENVFALDLDGLRRPDIVVWTAWRGQAIAAVGALKQLDPAQGEIKSMRAHPDYLGTGAGAALLDHLIATARARGYRRLSLETGRGPAFEPALMLYRRRGFVSGPAFADYVPNAFSQFLHLELGSDGGSGPTRGMTMRMIDLSHRIEEGMVTYKGLPAPVMCDFLSREASRPLYDEGAEFAIQSVTMVGNSGTYLDSPFHRYADGADLADLPLEGLAHLDAVVIDARGGGIAVDVAAFDGIDVAGRAVLVWTGWDRHWRTDAYFADHPFLTGAAADHLAAAGAALVGIDSYNIDDTRGRGRPVHTILLGAGIPICEHMTGLGAVPAAGGRFYAVPPKLVAFGTFPVRAFMMLGD